MSMVLLPEHISTIGRIDYTGADKYETVGEAVLIHGQTTGQTALAIRFPCNPLITALLRHPEKHDPCDKDLLEAYVSKLIESAFHYPFFHFLEAYVFPDTNILEGDGAWTFSYGYGTCDKSLFHRYVFGHPSDDTVDTGDYGKQLMFNYSRLEQFIEINTAQGEEEIGVDTED